MSSTYSSSVTTSSRNRVITSYDEVQRRQELRAKRRAIRVLGKIAVCICSVSTCATIVWLALYMRQEIFNFSETSSNHLDHTQSIDEAQFGYFGPQNENLWRAFLIANLGLSFLSSLYIPLGVLFEHYYPIILYGALMFSEAVLAIGNQYMSLPYYLASIIFFVTGFTVHVFVHFLRLDMVDEIVEWKRYKAEQLMKQRTEHHHHRIDDSHERSSSFELRSVRPKSSLAA